jgi:ribosomal protein S18 acetylase RimI-like enzyme
VPVSEVGSHIELRRAEAADEDFVLDLAAFSFAELGDYRAILAGWFSHPGVRTTLALSDGKPVGFSMLAFVRGEDDRRPTADLVAIAVVPAARRCGVAGALLTHVLGVARFDAVLLRAADVIRLEVADGNAAARALFTAAGFHHRPRGDGRYPSGERYRCLERPLAAPFSAGAAFRYAIEAADAMPHDMPDAMPDEMASI